MFDAYFMTDKYTFVMLLSLYSIHCGLYGEPSAPTADAKRSARYAAYAKDIARVGYKPSTNNKHGECWLAAASIEKGPTYLPETSLPPKGC